jgi:TonB-dependent starch-binding outer membrane protein SusC
MRLFLIRLGVILCIIILSLPALGQLTIEGEITDERGAPLPGANVLVRDTQYGAATDTDGRYSLTIPSPATDIVVEVRFVGFRTQRSTVTQREGTVELNFTLATDALRMDEVVVTGASAAVERRQLGNAISTISARDVELSGGLAIDQILSGRIAGAQVMQNSGRAAGGISVRLRGTSTVLGSADPLYVIDGVIVNNDSPELIRLGGYTQNRLVDINPNDIERIEVVKGAAAAALYGSRASNGVVQIFTRRGEIGAPRITIINRFQTSDVRKTIPVNMHPTNAAGDPVERYDFQDFIFRRAYGTEQHLSVSGGAPGTRYSTSLAYNNNQGIVHNSNFERINLRARLGQSVTDWFDLSVGAFYSYNVNNEVPHGGMRDNWGSLTGFIFGPNTYDPRPDPLTGEYSAAGILANPIEVLDRFEFSYTTKRFVGDVQLTITPSGVRGLSIENTTGYDTHNQLGLIYIPRGTTAPAPYAQGHSRRAERTVLQLNNDLNIRYQRAVSDGVFSTTLLGSTYQYDEATTFAAESEDLAPIAKIVPSGARNLVVGESRSERIIYGIFLQQTFGIADRLFVTGAVRADASSAFGEDERWQYYPKASASYLLSEERLWRDSRISAYIPELKLRASIGESGNWTAIGPYARFTNYGLSNYEGRPALIPSTIRGTADIRPERQREIELGVDMSLLANRAAIEFTYYNQHTTDLLLNRSLAPTSGFSSQLVNVGTLDNVGFELLLRVVPVQTRNVQWTSIFIYSQNRNEVDGLEEERLILGGFGFVAAINNEPIGVFFTTAYERDAQGNIVHDDNGLPVRAAESKIVGDPNPDFTASWTNEVQIGRNWNFRAQFDAVYGFDVLNFTRRLGSLPAFGTTKDYERELRGEHPAGYNARVFGIFEHWVEDGSFIKLRELAVSYTLFPRFWGMRSVTLSLIGRNLISIDDYSGYDPETNAEAQMTNVRGFDFVEPPIPRTFAFGVTMNF